MIFKWEDYFTEKQLEDGFDLDIKVESVIRAINYISADVIENGKTYDVSIDINDKFQIESCECECGKEKCHHMAAVIYALDEDNKYIEYDMAVEHLDNEKLIEFLKDQLSYNEDLLDEFKDKFRQDIIKEEILSYEDEVFMILDGIFWEENLNLFIENQLIECFNSGEYRYTLYLITLFFNRFLDKHSFDEEADMDKSWKIIVDLIEKIAQHEEDLVFDFLYECLSHNYSALYQPFGVLMKFFADNFNNEKYLKQKRKLFNV
ncbi:MAG: hypothetical protein IJQ68_08225 [Methanobrevibacter sp.]|uniref:SWIM zinc finger family protein n=1 Tax=Methanobrevibacter sp. TaxID=66852 RepID=UPI0025FC4657|nr:hypothetical protein [Methanobrevibacter sp.]MBR0271956.1 hypothetical protein [Methanobrevibacter sp.]